MRGELGAGASEGPCHALAPHGSGAQSRRDPGGTPARPPPLAGTCAVGAVGAVGAVSEQVPRPAKPRPRLSPVPRWAPPLSRGPAPEPRCPATWGSARGSPWRRSGSLQGGRATPPAGHLFLADFTSGRLRLRQRHRLPPRPTVRGGGCSPDPSPAPPGLPGTSGTGKWLMVRGLLLPFRLGSRSSREVTPVCGGAARDSESEVQPHVGAGIYACPPDPHFFCL